MIGLQGLINSVFPIKDDSFAEAAILCLLVALLSYRNLPHL